jgi:hypothetical protein
MRKTNFIFIVILFLSSSLLDAQQKEKDSFWSVQPNLIFEADPEGQSHWSIALEIEHGEVILKQTEMMNGEIQRKLIR